MSAQVSHTYETQSSLEQKYDDDKCSFQTIHTGDMSHIDKVNIDDDIDNIIDKLNYPFIHCWITPNGIVDLTQFILKFNLYIRHKHKKHGQPSLCLYNFQTTWQAIKYLHNKAFLSHDSRIHFAQMKFPQALDETLQHRNTNFIRDKNSKLLIVCGFIRAIIMTFDFDDIVQLIVNQCCEYLSQIKYESLFLQHNLNLMDDLFLINEHIKPIQSFDNNANTNHICQGPGRKHSFVKFWDSQRRNATHDDNVAVSHFLCQLFNSPSFAAKADYLYGQCRINEEMKSILKSKAKTRLDGLCELANKFILYKKGQHNEHRKLFFPKWKNTTFHTLYIATRPDRGTKLSLMDHWALKLEGTEWLLTLEWFNCHSFFIKFQKNDCLGQKVFWFSWKKNKKQFITQRWGTLNKLYVKDESKGYLKNGITAEKIGLLLEDWLKYSDYKYNTMSNNCQHFVRDFVSVFNEHVAEYLTTKFYHRRIEGIMTPSGALSNDWNEYSRIEEIRKRLLNVLQGNTETMPYKDVRDWLLEIEHIQYLNEFVESGYDTMNNIRIMTEQNLKDMGIEKMGHRNRIIHEIKKLNQK